LATMKNPTTSNIKETVSDNGVLGAEGIGLGAVESQSVLQSVYNRIMDAGSVWISGVTRVRIGGVAMRFYQVDVNKLPDPVKQKINELKHSTIKLTLFDDIPGLKQFIGNLNQSVYLIEHPDNVFLAHMGRLIAYCKKS